MVFEFTILFIYVNIFEMPNYIDGVRKWKLNDFKKYFDQFGIICMFPPLFSVTSKFLLTTF